MDNNKAKETTRNTLIVYVGQIKSKSFRYMVISSTCDGVNAGEFLTFDSRLITVSVGRGINCHSDDGKRWGSFTIADNDQNDFIQKHHADAIATWTADDRIRAERRKIETASKKPIAFGFDATVANMVKMTKHMTIREKMTAINYISNQILKG